MSKQASKSVSQSVSQFGSKSIAPSGTPSIVPAARKSSGGNGVATSARGSSPAGKPIVRSAGTPTLKAGSTQSAKTSQASGSTKAASKASTKASTKVSTKSSTGASTGASPIASPASTQPAAKQPITKRARVGGVRPGLPASGARKAQQVDVAVTIEVDAITEAVTPVAARTVSKSTASSSPTSSSSTSSATASNAAKTRGANAPTKPRSLSERPIDEIWREYRATPTSEVRHFLIARHLDLVAYAAERLHKRLPSEVEINDLKSAGAFGLMDAVESFDPDRGVKFETFCTQRIRGAMFDELRSMDWVPRLVRSRTAKVDKVRKSIEMETGNRPTEEEVASRLNVSGDEFEKLQKDSRPVSMVSLTRKCFETDSSKDVREIDVVEDGRQENPLQAVQKQDLQALITKGLSRAERLIVILYYYEEMTMKEIGATLDLSESRVSQMHSSILARLKAQMQHREPTEE
jgi:RNA polymerase sigma factor for flagellar operon FliA